MAATQEQLMKEIEGLKKFLPIKYYVLFTLLFLVGNFALEGLFTMLLDKTSFAIYLDGYHWKSLVWMGIWWFGLSMLERRYRQKIIRKKEAELQNFKISI